MFLILNNDDFIILKEENIFLIEQLRNLFKSHQIHFSKMSLLNISGANVEGWAPAAYLESINRRPSRIRSQDRLNEH